MNLARTSDNDPIRVDFLPQNLLGMTGQLGMTMAPGKQHHGMHFLWERNLAQDLDQLRSHYKTNCLVSLIEQRELDDVKIPTLFSEAQARGMQTYWFPIPDMQVPVSVTEVVQVVKDILALLQQGQVVVVHCMGGLGRTGVIVSCCLVALGHEPDAAIAKVRQTREYTVETQQQEEFVAEFSQAWTQDFNTQFVTLVTP
ncbi:MAG: cyclin-dependent kinase inhibitor 3 family protein [Microcoleaceae cyanobacterium]